MPGKITQLLLLTSTQCNSKVDSTVQASCFGPSVDGPKWTTHCSTVVLAEPIGPYVFSIFCTGASWSLATDLLLS